MDTNKEQGKETREPLAKFQAKLDKEGRVMIPKAVREAFGLEKNDYIEVIVRKIEIDKAERKVIVLKQAYLITRIGNKGQIFLPSDLKKKFQLSNKDIVEILIYGFHKFDELVSDKGKQLLGKIQTVGKWTEISKNQKPPLADEIDHYTYVFV